tara:strand:- start:44 stop:547 length:504 start_codon:yes stop_codon:yes gene_type:complete
MNQQTLEADAPALSDRFTIEPWYHVDFGLAFRDQSLADLHRLWQQKCRAGRLPARKDFDFAELKPFFGRVFICQVNEERTDLTFSLIGTEIVDHMGADSTRKTVSQVMGRDVLRLDLHLLAYPRAVREYGFVGWREREREHKPFETVVLPLADDGVTVDRLFGSIIM